MHTFLTYVYILLLLLTGFQLLDNTEELSVLLSTVAKFLQSVTMTALIEYNYLTVLLEYFDISNFIPRLFLGLMLS